MDCNLITISPSFLRLTTSACPNLCLLLTFIGLRIVPQKTWHQFSSVQSLSRVRLFATPWTAAHQASLSITHSQSLLKLMSIESVMPSNRLILCRPLLLLPSIFSSMRVFSNESALRIRWPNMAYSLIIQSVLFIFMYIGSFIFWVIILIIFCLSTTVFSR